jgi:hypothetical protein
MAEHLTPFIHSWSMCAVIGILFVVSAFNNTRKQKIGVLTVTLVLVTNWMLQTSGQGPRIKSAIHTIVARALYCE